MPSTKSFDRTSIIAVHSAQTIDEYGHHIVEILPLTTLTVPPYTTTNAVFFGQQAFWLIDPGSPFEDQQSILKTYIERRQTKGGKLLGVCLTHHHGDHSKAAEFVAARFAVPIFAHRQAAKFVKFSFKPLNDSDVITHQGELTLRALHTPGHSEDHLVYYAQELGILVAGDMITDRGTILIPPLSGSLSVYLNSLESLTHLKLNAIIPAHGQAIVDEPKKFLIKALKHRFERIKAVLTAIKDQDCALDATDITRIVYQNTIAENLVVFAQLSVESSLHWLKDAGLVDNPHHLWQLCRNATHKEKAVLLDHLKKIDERLRDA